MSSKAFNIIMAKSFCNLYGFMCEVTKLKAEDLHTITILAGANRQCKEYKINWYSNLRVNS